MREVIELRMFEMKLKQKDLAELLETSTSRISEYLNGKRDITIEIARSLHKKLNIDRPNFPINLIKRNKMNELQPILPDDV